MTFMTKVTLESLLCNYIENELIKKKMVIKIEGIVKGV